MINNVARIFFLFSLSLNCFSQNLDSLGLNDSPLLSMQEVDYFNQEFSTGNIASSFRDSIDGFDFYGKKVGFFSGSSGKSIYSKRKYFSSVKHRTEKGYHPKSSDQLLVLNNEEKLKSGGFDIIIISWSKLLIFRPTEKMLQQLRDSGV